MNITVIGAGYVGLATGACFSELGNKVYCVDSDIEKINQLNNNIIPIYEPGLSDMVYRNTQKNRLLFTDDLKEALQNTEICVIAVGTPMCMDGGADLQYIDAAAESIGKYIEHDCIVVNKSTVPVGTAVRVETIIYTELKKRKKESLEICVVSNPEFLKEGSAIKDCMSPDRIVIGSTNENAIQVLRELYAPMARTNDRIIIMDAQSAEMTKYASNAMLATRISFMNEIANICEQVGANVNSVRLGMAGDQRIGKSFLYAGCGYGGSCFPKDIQALIKTAADHGYHAGVLEKVEEVNQRQKRILAEKVQKRFGLELSGISIAVWGLTFKPNTDDMRHAPAISIITSLLEAGATVHAYDPMAKPEDCAYYFGDYSRIQYFDDMYAAAKDTDALILVTEWMEFRSPDFNRLQDTMRCSVIFDGRNQYSAQRLAKKGFEYYPIGMPPVSSGEAVSIAKKTE